MREKKTKKKKMEKLKNKDGCFWIKIWETGGCKESHRRLSEEYRWIDMVEKQKEKQSESVFKGFQRRRRRKKKYKRVTTGRGGSARRQRIQFA